VKSDGNAKLLTCSHVHWCMPFITLVQLLTMQWRKFISQMQTFYTYRISFSASAIVPVQVHWRQIYSISQELHMLFLWSARLCVSIWVFAITCTSQKHAQFFIPMRLDHFQHFSKYCFVKKSVIIYLLAHIKQTPNFAFLERKYANFATQNLRRA